MTIPLTLNGTLLSEFETYSFVKFELFVYYLFSGRGIYLVEICNLFCSTPIVVLVLSMVEYCCLVSSWSK